MTQDWTTWRKALHLGKGRRLTREQAASLKFTTDPQTGFWRMKQKSGDLPVAIWRGDDGKMIAVSGQAEKRADDVWTWCCNWPITEAVYRAVVAGGAWPEEAVAEGKFPKDHNVIKTGIPAQDMQQEFIAQLEIAKVLLKQPITDQDEADQVAMWANKIATIKGNADLQFKVEKKPHLEAGKAVDESWRWRSDAEDTVKALKRHSDAWLKHLESLEKQRQAKAQAEAEKLRLEAQQKAEASGIGTLFANQVNNEVDELSRKAAEAERAAQPQKVSAGRVGASISLRTFYIAEVTNYDDLVMALKDDPDVREAVLSVANRIARSKDALMPAGSKRIEDKRAA